MSKTIKVTTDTKAKPSNENVLLDVVENIIVDNNASKKTIKEKCCAAVKHTTKENSLNDLNKGYCVYLTEKSTSGKNTIYSSYVQCSKSPVQTTGETQKNEDLFCHIHAKTNPDKIIKMVDLVKNSFKATLNHEYYGDMGVRGAKGNKKSIRDTKESVSTKNISYILESGNQTLMKNLEQYAEQLVIKLIKSKQSKMPVVIEHSNDELLDFLQNNDSKNELDKSNNLKNDSKNDSKNELKNNDSNNDSKNESFEIESDDESLSDNNNLLQSSHQNNVDEIQNVEEDEIECVEISTINGSSFFLDTSSFDVYKIVEDDNILVGKLKEISEKYSQINYNGKKYSIFCQETSGGKTYLKCYITNKKFDLNLKVLK